MESAAGGDISFIAIGPLTILALVTLGFLGGLLSGFIGSGGAFVLTPGMMNLGVPGSVAVASNMAHKFPKALVGAWRRRKLGHVDLKLGLVVAVSAIAGVKVGVQVQNVVRDAWGDAGSNLYISVTFVTVLVVVATYMLTDVRKDLLRGSDYVASSFAQRVARLKVPPMVYFKTANARISVWVTVPLGFATGMLAATIAVGGFIGVPGMIYVVGAPAFVASGTELVIAFCMGAEGTYEWAVRGFVDLRLTILILAGSLVGVQVGALGTSYVKEYMIKVVAAVIMLLASVSRAVMIPAYLSDLGVIPMGHTTYDVLNNLSRVVLYGTMLVAGGIIARAIILGMKRSAPQRGTELVLGALQGEPGTVEEVGVG
jgi:uncharacterized membrane protein YfcA